MGKPSPPAAVAAPAFPGIRPGRACFGRLFAGARAEAPLRSGNCHAARGGVPSLRYARAVTFLNGGSPPHTPPEVPEAEKLPSADRPRVKAEQMHRAEPADRIAVNDGTRTEPRHEITP